MALPIEPTPVLTGEDADRLLSDLKNVASREEIARRRVAAKAFVADMTRKKASRCEP